MEAIMCWSQTFQNLNAYPKNLKVAAFIITIGSVLLWAVNHQMENTVYAIEDQSAVVGHYAKLNDHTYILALQPGAKLLRSLRAFQEALDFPSASLNGIGLTRNTVLGLYKFNSDGSPLRTHTEVTVPSPSEVVSLHCNFTSGIASDENKISPSSPHCHIAIAGDDANRDAKSGGWSVTGGHLIEAEVAVTMELIVTTYSKSVLKRPSAEFGGVLLDIAESEGGQTLNLPRKKILDDR
jgi:predicted DNA-binding protein with PD1-like motif